MNLFRRNIVLFLSPGSVFARLSLVKLERTNGGAVSHNNNTEITVSRGNTIKEQRYLLLVDFVIVGVNNF